MEKIKTEDVLKEIGFQKFDNKFEYLYKGYLIKATQVTDTSFCEVLLFTRILTSKRSIAFVEFKLPIFVDSFEQGLALLVYFLNKNQIKIEVEWFYKGESYQAMLPWASIKTENRLLASVMIQSQWMRDICKSIRQIAETVSEEDITTFSYDGRKFKIFCNGSDFHFVGYGDPWEYEVSVYTKKLINLPKRIPDYEVNINVYENRLNVLYRSFEIIN